ncbi:MAG: hypothetical protein WCB12_23015 [Bryobacteraceae bacterium]
MRILLPLAFLLIGAVQQTPSSLAPAEPCSDPGYSWQKLDAIFQKAKAPAKQDLVGTWVMTGFVLTGSFGGVRKDVIRSDCAGIKRNGKFEWALKFSATQDDHLAANSRKIGDSPQDSRISFEPDGTLILRQDDGGDSIVVYRCRMSDPKALVCVYSGTPGHGMEFRKKEK